MTVSGGEGEVADGRSLHERIAADLRDEIMSGDLAPGASLPSTVQLKERFTASNATVQKALRLLKEERLVVGRAGASVTVRDHRQRTMRPASYMEPAAPGRPYRWLTEAAGSAARAHSTLVEVAEAVPPADVTEALGMRPGDTAVLRRQVLSIDGEPAELVASYYPLEVAGGTEITERRRIPGGTPTLLASLGYPPRLSVDRVSARVATQDQYRLLGLPGDLPVLRTLRVVFSDHDRPIEATVMVKAGHLYEVQYEFAPGAG
ncbi:GntR family transcriptional regulator [Streptomyces sp. NBC_01012]|uniref:GntR family transcriptional regulator n=1 Tax=Streptomyces sp. NBC_01012 TaxID=2903717 RepID=UPI00386D47EE|nr:GntR family transcriptional regulator [Streptomyces sp. NBC_01012]